MVCSGSCSADKILSYTLSLPWLPCLLHRFTHFFQHFSSTFLSIFQHFWQLFVYLFAHFVIFLTFLMHFSSVCLFFKVFCILFLPPIKTFHVNLCFYFAIMHVIRICADGVFRVTLQEEIFGSVSPLIHTFNMSNSLGASGGPNIILLSVTLKLSR